METQSIEIALKQHQQALLHNPKDLDEQIICGNLCVELQRFEEAAGYFRRIVRVLKNNLTANNALCFALQSLGNVAHNNGNFLQAEACFQEALEYQPNNAIYWYNLGNAQRELGKTQNATGSFKQSIKFNPNDADAHNNLGNMLREIGQLDKAILSYQTALKLKPSLHHALAHLAHQKQHICDWQDLTVQINTLRGWVKTEPSAQISPFAFISMPGTTPQEQQQCATNWANQQFQDMISKRMDIGLQSSAMQSLKPKQKLKIGYLSADFRLHPLAFLITELIEKHDRSKFEIVAYSYGVDDKTLARKHLEKAFDVFNDIRPLSDTAAAKKIRDDGIDILVDLTGFTQSSRTGIVALKPAPISINWLGFAGTMGELNGAPLFDYLLADNIIAPKLANFNLAYFSEKLLYLPCYQPNNSQRPVGKSTTKLENNLPENGFIFCCFNQSFKITAAVFCVWLRLLEKTPHSILWLLDCNQWAKANLLAAAEHAGIKKDRLIFAPRVAIDIHLERHKHADLFLDTLPYNAHTTASDALFIGLPVLTCMGDTFASRVAASLLQRINMAELVTDSLPAYEEKALQLAHNPQQLAQLKQTLSDNIEQSKLFKPAQFARDLEQIYEDIWANYLACAKV